MKKLLLSTLLVTASAAASAFVLEWDKITHWAGQGPNKAALVVQFMDDYDEVAYVWGYRWEDGENATGEAMVRTIAADNNDLVAYIQFTGPMGCTLDGLGYSRDNEIIDYLSYDYESAAADPFISFGFDTPSLIMGQTSAPTEEEVRTMYADAIEAARETHVIEHPLNQHKYGYPAYDYDWLQPTETRGDMRWNAGWYTGYWSYWLGKEDSDQFVYSGLGMSSVVLKDGDVNGWKFMPLDGPVTGDDWDAVSGASTPWHDPDYQHFELSAIPSGITAVNPGPGYEDVYTVTGHRVLVNHPAKTPYDLAPGVYIVKNSIKTHKIIIK